MKKKLNAATSISVQISNLSFLEAKFVFSEKYLTYRLSEKMAIIPVERRFTSGMSTLKWHTRWSRRVQGDDSDEHISDNEGEEPPNWASGFIVFKVRK